MVDKKNIYFTKYIEIESILLFDIVVRNEYYA